MCEQRRAMFEVSDMSGSEPKQIISVNLNKLQFMLALTAVCFVLIGGLWTTTAIAYSWMERKAESNYNIRISDDLHPPAGEIYSKVGEMIHTHQIETESEFHKALDQYDSRLSRVEMISALTYKAVTGNEVPDIN